MHILIIGSANVDTTLYVERFPKNGETLIAKSMSIDIGGKGLNQAIAAKRAGADVTFLTALGNDSNAKLVTDSLDAEHLIYKVITKDNVPTGTAYIMVSDDAHNQIIIDKGANGELNAEDVKNNMDLIKKSDIVILQGELLLETNEYIMRVAKELGKIVICNPAPYKEISGDYYKYIDFYIPNETELALAVQGDDSYQKKCFELIKRGVDAVIVTLGDKGSFYCGEESFNVDVFKTNAIDTVAAGDTYIGYFAAGLSKGMSVKESMLLASKASSITVSREGAAKAIPYINELQNYNFAV